MSFKSSLYILGNCPLLLNVPCAKVFSQPVACLHFLDIVFLRAEVFNFNEAQLVKCFFQGVAFGVESTQSLLCSRSFRSPGTLRFTFRNIIHLVLICVKSV